MGTSTDSAKSNFSLAEDGHQHPHRPGLAGGELLYADSQFSAIPSIRARSI
jgi:hypothetical protein